MNKRILQKAATKERIISSALELFSAKGIINTSTQEIAAKAEIAHGTLFIHFPTKESLISELLDRISDDFFNLILLKINKSFSFEEVLQLYLKSLISNEDFFASLYREFSFYQPELQRKILYKQSLLVDIIIRYIREQCEKSGSPVNISLVANQFFGTIYYYLSLKNFFVKSGSILETINDDLIRNLHCLINCKNNSITIKSEEK